MHEPFAFSLDMYPIQVINGSIKFSGDSGKIRVPLQHLLVCNLFIFFGKNNIQDKNDVKRIEKHCIS